MTSITRSNLEYIENLYQSYLQNPETLDPQWRLFFEGVEFAQNLPGQSTFSEKELGVYNLIQQYRDYGHLKAKLDPLGLSPARAESFDLAQYGLTNADLDQKFAVGALVGMPKSTLREIIDHLDKSYCQTLTCQVAECPPQVREWFRKEFEQNATPLNLTADERREIFKQLARTESLEKFIHTRYVGTKRFSIEGGDALIPMLERSVQKGTALGVEEIVIGMAHRGRVNVLANFMDKAIDVIFSEFDGTAFEQYEYDGDVKYHMGYSSDRQTANGPCHISLAFNPSHLEAVDPVVMGMSRAKQRRRLDTVERKKVVPILIHGDAAFAGQGVVTETLQLSKLQGYTVGGTVHVIVNNQVGFTTDPEDARSVRYSSDVAKVIKAPVLLVNGDDVEACVRAMDMAVRFRQQFGEDVVIDQICYRRFGHNEGDEPAFTQPVMYEAIRQHATLMNLYLDQLQAQGVMTKEQGEAFFKEKIDNLQNILDNTRKNRPVVKANAFNAQWKGLRRGTLADFDKPTETRVAREVLDKVSKVLTEEPKGVNLNPKIAKLIGARKQMAETGHLDWAMGELLAYGSLCLEGTPVRVSGQDCKRGTFTHRQAVYYDVKSDEQFCPLATLNPDKGEFCIYNSPLSEYAVLGFEYGNSFSDPTYLTVWEAQFGDFANGAQIIIDQFLSSGEEKWARGSGLTLLLPHGYEGQGPEHSSARLERFLQLCAQANMQVCNLTTPANLFHVLRRQMKRDFRKPLVIMSPKSLLRHPKVVSAWDEFTKGTFNEVMADPKVPDVKSIETLVLCSGKLYYDLDAARDEKYKDSVGSTCILRTEQLYPFPRTQLASFVSGMNKLSRVIWVQEEPKNMGAWLYIQPKINDLLQEIGKKKLAVEYIGRTERASPAVGSPYQHQKEQTLIIDSVFKK
ncbi:MAG: 2-oxoglutarate dehydrogenase E1 component [Bdellovibrionales bacterium]|nr:2-oxoglutarate dehydrogenase E1 component [Bdellovibrionales bacterium]